LGIKAKIRLLPNGKGFSFGKNKTTLSLPAKNGEAFSIFPHREIEIRLENWIKLVIARGEEREDEGGP